MTPPDTLHCNQSESSRREDLPERGRVRKNNSGNANRTEMGRGMNGKGMEHGSATFIALPFIPLPSPPEVLDCGSAALRALPALLIQSSSLGQSGPTNYEPSEADLDRAIDGLGLNTVDLQSSPGGPSTGLPLGLAVGAGKDE